MSELPENEKDFEVSDITDTSQETAYHDELDEFATIFSDPAEHKNKAPKNGNKKRILAVVAAFVSVAVLVSGTIAVIKLIPEKEDENASSSPFEEITVVDVETDSLADVTVTNSNGTFKLISEQTVTESGDDSSSESADDTSSETETVETTWYVEGIDKSLVSSSSISSIVSSAASITASRKIDTKSAADCGLEAPVYKVDVTSREAEGYSVLVGSESPDGTGTYLKLSTSDDIYLVNSSAVSGFEFELLDLADTTAFAAASFEADVSAYSGDDGTLISFDKMTVSGKNFPETVTIVPVDSESDLSAYLAYKVITPSERYAENVDSLLSVFSSGLTVSGAYSFDVSAKSLAAVGLDNPDIIISIEIAGEKKTYKMSQVDDENFAVINDDSVMIKKVAASNISFASYKTEDFYSTWVLMQSINDISNFTLSYQGTDYSFDIVYDDSEDAEETYVITHNGEKITAEYFQSFYQTFVGLNCSDFTVEQLSAEPEVSIRLTYSADGSVKTLDFVKCSETKYQYSIDGEPLGRVTSSALNKLIKNIKLVSQNKNVE